MTNACGGLVTMIHSNGSTCHPSVEVYPSRLQFSWKKTPALGRLPRDERFRRHSALCRLLGLAAGHWCRVGQTLPNSQASAVTRISSSQSLRRPRRGQWIGTEPKWTGLKVIFFTLADFHRLFIDTHHETVFVTAEKTQHCHTDESKWPHSES